MPNLVRSLYRSTQRLFRAFGIYFAATRLSARNVPELINRAVWKPFVVPDEWRTLYNESQSLTGGEGTDNIFRQCRLYSTLQLAAYAATLPDGDVIECGCWHGHSTVAISRILARHGFQGRFHVFDSFEGGLSEFTSKDESSFALSQAEKESMRAKFVSSEDFVRKVTAEFGFVELHKGWIPAVFATFQPRALRFVHVDVDMYEPTIASLDLFWDHLVPGGCLVVDDYSHAVFEGATRAVDEFLAKVRPRMLYKVPFGSCFLIK